MACIECLGVRLGDAPGLRGEGTLGARASLDLSNGTCFFNENTIAELDVGQGQTGGGGSSDKDSCGPLPTTLIAEFYDAQHFDCDNPSPDPTGCELGLFDWNSREGVKVPLIYDPEATFLGGPDTIPEEFRPTIKGLWKSPGSGDCDSYTLPGRLHEGGDALPGGVGPIIPGSGDDVVIRFWYDPEPQEQTWGGVTDHYWMNLKYFGPRGSDSSENCYSCLAENDFNDKNFSADKTYEGPSKDTRVNTGVECCPFSAKYTGFNGTTSPNTCGSITNGTATAKWKVEIYPENRTDYCGDECYDDDCPELIFPGVPPDSIATKGRSRACRFKGLIGRGLLKATGSIEHRRASSIIGVGTLNGKIVAGNGSIGAGTNSGGNGITGIGTIKSRISTRFSASKHFIAEGLLTSEMPDKFVGDFNLLCGQKLYPTKDVENDFFLDRDLLQDELYKSIDEGVISNGYTVDGHTGSNTIVSDDDASYIEPSGKIPRTYTYKAEVGNILVTPADSRIFFRAAGPDNDFASTLPPRYTLSNIKLEDPDENLIVKYEDISVRGDGHRKYSTYSSSGILINTPTFDSHVPNIFASGCTISFEVITHCQDSAFTFGFDDGYDDSCDIYESDADGDDFHAVRGSPMSTQGQALGRNPSLQISALEICNSGERVAIPKHLPLTLLSPASGKRDLEKCILASEFFGYGFDTTIWPANISEWSNELGYTNRDTAQLGSLLSSLRDDHDSTSITLDHTSITDSGKLILKFSHEAPDSYYRVMGGAFSESYQDLPYDAAENTLFNPHDPFFVADSGNVYLKIRAKKPAGGRDFAVDVVGYSNDKIFAVTSPSGGFLQNLEGSGDIPDTTDYVGGDYQAFSSTPISTIEEANVVDVIGGHGGDHYLLATIPSISGVGFQDYEVPLGLPPRDRDLPGAKYASSSYFENIILDMYPFPSGASVASIELCVRYSPSNALGLYTLGKAGKITDDRSEGKIYPSARQSGDPSFNNGPDVLPLSTIEDMPHGYKSPNSIKTNYSRRWRGFTGIAEGPFAALEYNHAFNNPTVPNPFNLGFYNFESDSGNLLFSINDDDDAIGSLTNSYGNERYYQTLGWRYVDQSVYGTELPGYTGSYKTIDWTSLSNGGSNFTDSPLYGKIADSFDTAVRIDGPNVKMEFGNVPATSGFSLYTRFAPDYTASGNFFNSGVIISKYDSDPMQFVLGYCEQKLCVTASDNDGAIYQIKDSITYDQYQYPLAVLVTYSDQDRKMRLYADNEIASGDFTNLRATSSEFARSIEGSHNLTVGYSPGSGMGFNFFVDEVGISSGTLGETTAVEFLETVRNKFWSPTEVYADGTTGVDTTGPAGGVGKLWSYVDEDTRQFGYGPFSICPFSSAFDQMDNIVGRDGIQFRIDHHGSGYPAVTNKSLPSSVPGAAYHSQIENDFLRFNLTDAPDNFYAVAPRIVKKFPRGYEFNKGAIVAELMVEHRTSNSFVWDDGAEGAKFIVSLYTDNQHSDTKENMGLISRKTFNLSSGCMKRLDVTFDYDDMIDETETWSTYPQDRLWTEMEHKYYKDDISKMFMQIDLAYPSGDKFDSVIDVYAAHVRLDEAYVIPTQTTNNINLTASGAIPDPASGIQDLYLLGGAYLNNSLDILFSGAHIPLNNGPSGIPLYVEGAVVVTAGLDLVMSGAHAPKNNSVDLSLLGGISKIANSLELVMPSAVYANINNAPGLDLFLLVADSGKTSIDMTVWNQQVLHPFNLFIQNDQSVQSTTSNIPLNLFSTDNDGLFSSTNLFLKNIPPVSNSSSGLMDVFIAGSSYPVYQTGPFGDSETFNLYLKTDEFPPLSRFINLFVKQDETSSALTGTQDLFLQGYEDCNLLWNNDNLGTFITNVSMTHGDLGAFDPGAGAHCIDRFSDSYSDSDLLKLGNVTPDGDGYGLKKMGDLIPNNMYTITITGKTSSNETIPLPSVWDRWQSGVKILADHSMSGVMSDLPQYGFFINESGRLEDDLFGYSVSIDNDTMVVGSPRHSYDESGVNYLEDAGAAFVYRRVAPSSALSKGDWYLEQKIVPPSSLRMPSARVSYNSLTDTNEVYRTLGLKNRKFGSSVVIKGDHIAVGAPQAKIAYEEPVAPSSLCVASLVFTNEANQYRNQAGVYGNDLFDYNTFVSDKDLYYRNWLFDSRSLDQQVLLYQPDPSGTYENLISSNQPLPSFVKHTTIGRKGFGDTYTDWSNQSGYIFNQIKDHFLASTSGCTPPIISIFVDYSNSMSRSSLEPAIDDFVAWYKDFTFESGVVDIYGVRSSGYCFEPSEYPVYGISRNESEQWLKTSKYALESVLDSAGSSKFISSGVRTSTLSEYNMPVDSGGRVYVFLRDEGVWRFKQDIVAVRPAYTRDSSAFEAPNLFGTSVDITSDSGVLIVGAKDADNTGAVYRYNLTSKGNMTGGGSLFNLSDDYEKFYDFTQKIVAPNGNANDEFGHSISIDDDASKTFIVGAPKHGYDEYNLNFKQNAGAAYLYSNPVEYVHSGVIEYHRFGNQQRAANNHINPHLYDDLEELHTLGARSSRIDGLVGYFQRIDSHGVPIGVGLAYVINPELVSASTEVADELKTWLSYGDRRLVIAGEGSNYSESNASVNLLLESLGSEMRLGDTNKMDDLCDNYSNIWPTVSGGEHQIFRSPNPLGGLFGKGVNTITGGIALAKSTTDTEESTITTPADSGFNNIAVWAYHPTTTFDWGAQFSEPEFVWTPSHNDGALSINYGFEVPEDGVLKIEDPTVQSEAYSTLVSPSSVVAAYEVHYSGGVGPASSDIVLIAGTRSEEGDVVSINTSGTSDNNLLFYKNLYPECNTPGLFIGLEKDYAPSGQIFQLGGWTGNDNFKSSSINKKSALSEIYITNGFTITENHIGAISGEAKLAWIATPSSVPTSTELQHVTDWLGTGGKRLVITYDDTPDQINNVSALLSDLDSTMRPYYVPSRSEYASVAGNEGSLRTTGASNVSFDFNRSATANHGIFTQCSGETERIDDVFAYGAVNPIDVGSGSHIIRGNEAIFGRGTLDQYCILAADATEIFDTSSPVVANSGYIVFFDYITKSPNTVAGIRVIAPNHHSHPMHDGYPFDITLEPNYDKVGQVVTASGRLIADSNGKLNFYFSSPNSYQGIRCYDFVPESVVITSVSGYMVDSQQLSYPVPVFSGWREEWWFTDEFDTVIPSVRYIPDDAATVVAFENYGSTTSEIMLLSDSNILQGECEAYRSQFGVGGTLVEGNQNFIKNLYPVSPVESDDYALNKKIVADDRKGVADYITATGIVTPGDHFGHSVAIHNQRSAVGSPYHGYNELGDLMVASGGGHGAVYSFENADLSSQWPQTQKLSPSGIYAGYDNITEPEDASGILGTHTYNVSELASWMPESDRFGWSIDLECDLLAIGVPGHNFGYAETTKKSGAFSAAFSLEFDKPTFHTIPSGDAVLNAGAVYNYKYDRYKLSSSSGTWSLDQKIVSAGKTDRRQRNTITETSGTENDFFGTSVAIDNRNRAESQYILLAGAYNHDYDEDGSNILSNAGAAFTYDGNIIPAAPSSGGNNHLIASVYGDSIENKQTLRVDQADGDSLIVTATGVVWTNNQGELFLEASGFDVGGLGLAKNHVRLLSVKGSCDRGTSLVNDLNLFLQAPPSTEFGEASGTDFSDANKLNLYVGGDGPTSKSNNVDLFTLNQTYTSNIPLVLVGASGVPTGTLNLVLPSSVASATGLLTLYTRGK